MTLTMIADTVDLDHLSDALDNAAACTLEAERLDHAMTAARHTADVSHDWNLDCAVAVCSSCGATYRAFPDEPTPRVWTCSLHQKRNNQPKGGK